MCITPVFELIVAEDFFLSYWHFVLSSNFVGSVSSMPDCLCPHHSTSESVLNVYKSHALSIMDNFQSKISRALTIWQWSHFTACKKKNGMIFSIFICRVIIALCNFHPFTSANYFALCNLSFTVWRVIIALCNFHPLTSANYFALCYFHPSHLQIILPCLKFAQPWLST